MEEIKTIFDDKREIECVRGQHGSMFAHQQWSSESGLIDKIVAYKEHGPMGWIPYIAVYLDGEIKVRLNALEVEIIYKDK